MAQDQKAKTFSDLQKAVGVAPKGSRERERPFEYTPLQIVQPTRRRARLQRQVIQNDDDSVSTATTKTVEMDESKLGENEVSDLASRVRIFAHIGERGAPLFRADMRVEDDEDVWRVCHQLERWVGPHLGERERCSILLSRAPELSWCAWSQLIYSAVELQRRGGGVRVCIEAMGLPSVSVMESLTFGAGFDAIELDYVGEDPPDSEKASDTLLLKGELSYMAMLCYRIERRHTKNVKCRTLATLLWLWLAGEIDVGDCCCLQCGMNLVTAAICDLVHRGIINVNPSVKKAQKVCERLSPIDRLTQEHLTAFKTFAKIECAAWTAPI